MVEIGHVFGTNLGNMARPEGPEFPTIWFEAGYSVQPSYGALADVGCFHALAGGEHPTGPRSCYQRHFRYYHLKIR